MGEPSGPTSPSNGASKAAQLHSQSAALEQMSMEIHQTQQHLFRQQVTTLTADIAALRQEVAQLHAKQEDTKAGLTSMVDAKCRDLHMRIGDLGEMTGKHGQAQEVVKVQLDQLHTVFNSLKHNSGAYGELQGNLESLANHRANLDAKHASLHAHVGNLGDKLQHIADTLEAH